MSNIHNKAKKKRDLMRRQRGRCWLCGEPMSSVDATFDHLIPKSLFGTASTVNLKLAHRSCNGDRGRSLDAVFMRAAGIVALRWNIRSIGGAR